MQSPCNGFQPVLDSQKVRTASAQCFLSPEKLIRSLSYSHFELLIGLDDDLKRAFYEVECFRGKWSVRELRRQINSLHFERSGLSENKKKLAELAQSGTEQTEPELAVRDPYIFDLSFWGLNLSGSLSLHLDFWDIGGQAFKRLPGTLSQGRCMLIA